DAKLAITSSLNLDLTINPDFSQVEVDKQVTNLDRFELFFPERRQFFLENADLFANFGYPTIRPFFSRRIGLGVPINFGARLSGNINKDWRIGVMDMQTGKVEERGLPTQNFAVMALQRRVFSRSNVRLLFVNKQSINYHPDRDTTKPVYTDYNRNIGLEYNLASSNNLWTGKALMLKSFTPGLSGNDFVHAANLQYASRNIFASWQHEYVGRNYSAEVGYVPRRNYIRINPQLGYLFFPKKGAVLSHGPRGYYFSFFTPSLHQTDDEALLLYNFNFRNQSVFTAWAAHDFVLLLQPFDPTNSGKDTLARGTKHRWYAYGTDYFSRPQQLFTFSFSTRYGGYYAGGKRLNLSGDFGYRLQPYVSLTLSASYNNIDLPQPWGQTNLWLVGPRVDITFTNKLYLTTFLQYNNQLRNINLNTRFQWRYKPASDLFLVYTDNYLPSPFSVRNRALVLKLTYWWNP
ncbi:MAG: hydrolase, partial [Flavisolibacter sp.]|nr:hydrolase [Flavisolibacter sp.]